MILKLLFIFNLASAWTIEDLLKKEIPNHVPTAFNGGNYLEKTLEQVQLVVERDDGREGQEYFLKVNPRGGKELLAQNRLARISEETHKTESVVYKNLQMSQRLQIAIDLLHAKKLDLLIENTKKLLQAQKQAQMKALTSTDYGNAKEYIKSSIAIKNFSLKMIEIHSRKMAINAAVAQMEPSWNLDNFEMNEGLLNRVKIVEHVKGYGPSVSPLVSQLDQLRVEHARAIKDISLSKNDKLIDSVSLGFDNTREEPTFSFRVSFNMPYLSSNPVQDWEAHNKIIEAEKEARDLKTEQSILLATLKAQIIHTAEDLDLDLSQKWNGQVEKALFKLKESDPLSAFSLYTDFMIARISMMEAERDLYLSYLQWLDLSQDYTASIFSHLVGGGL